ncbi:flavodoxin domain-containing protein [Streptomyces sp. NPDC001816]|uniref:flavodoxin domain-containing protein n=1 Tax=Streptomyces sp. NPDC001816 TaxID=3364612 RepID=UPI00369D362D
MSTRVLVAYGTTNGSTAQIAETVAEALLKEGLTAQARPARSVTSVAPYDAVVVGGALYAGRWHRDARRFLRRHRRELAERPLWLFSSGPLDASASERDIPPVLGVRRAMDRLTAIEHATFGGCLQEGAKGRIAGMLLRDGKGGDFRDVPAIEEWARHIAAGLPPG